MWASLEVPGRSNVPARVRNALLVNALWVKHFSLCVTLQSSQHILFSGHYFCPLGAEQLQITFRWDYCLVGLWIRSSIFPPGFCMENTKASWLGHPGWLAATHKFWVSRVFWLNHKIYAEIYFWGARCTAVALLLQIMLGNVTGFLP